MFIAGFAIIAYCGELRCKYDDVIDNSNSQYVHALNKKIVVDANFYKDLAVKHVYGRGYLVNEAFEGIANVNLKGNKMVNPTYLIRCALIDIK